MIRFMVISAPRSGPAWAANWLTTDTTLCLHDPLWGKHYEELDTLRSAKMLGIACTGIANFPQWVNAHKARKVVLHRAADEINESLAKIGMPSVTQAYVDGLWKIDGMHVPWENLFHHPASIYEHLLQRPFDEERHKMLCSLEVQMNFEGIVVNHEATARLIGELQRAMYTGRIQ